MTLIPEPGTSTDLRGLLLDHLDHERSSIIDRLTGMPPMALRQTRVPSGWTPAGLVNHLANVERRWMEWGFLGIALPDPWRDRAGHGWVTPGLDVDAARDLLDAAGRRTREIAEAHALDEVARLGGRFRSPAEAPHLQWILLHLLTEYARHAGHLDIARELVDGNRRRDD